jgi:hypothetical protein
MPRTRKPQPIIPLVGKIEADLAYLFRLRGASWQEIADRFGYANGGAAHNRVYGGHDPRSYAPGRTIFKDPGRR